MLGQRWLSVFFFLLVAAVVWPLRASAASATDTQTRVWEIDLAAHALVGSQYARSTENHEAKSIAEYTLASDSPFAAEGGATAITRGEQVTEQVIRNAMKDAPLSSQQAGGVSLPRVQQYVDKLLAGEAAPAIKVDGGMIVDGNHRYIAGRIVGQEPPVIQWLGGRPGSAVPWANLPVKPEAW